MEKVSSLSKSVGRKRHPKRFWALMIVAGGIIVITLLSVLSSFAAAPRGTATFTVIDTGNNNRDVSDVAKVSIYSCDISDKSVEQIRKLEYKDFTSTLDKAIASEVSIYLNKENNLYWAKIEYKGSVIWRVPQIRDNNILIVEESSTNNVVILDKDYSNVTDSSEEDFTAYITTEKHEGLISGYLFDEDEMNLVVLTLDFDFVQLQSAAKIKDYYNYKHVSGTRLYLGVSTTVVEDGELGLEITNGTVVGSAVQLANWADIEVL